MQQPQQGEPTVLPKKNPKMYAKQSLQTTMPHGSVNHNRPLNTFSARNVDWKTTTIKAM